MNNPDELQQAIDKLNQQEFAASAEICSRILDAEPTNGRVWHIAGIANAQQGDLQVAIECFQKAVDNKPEVADYHYNLGLAHRRMGNSSEAAAGYRAAIERNPEHVEAINNLGNVLMSLTEYTEAIEAFRKVLEATPEEAVAHFNLANALQDSGDIPQAIVHLKKAIECDPDFDSARENLGRTFSDTRKFEQAIEVWRDWLNHSPGNPIPQHMLAALTGEDAPDRCADECVRSIFDSTFASCFDRQLGQIGYRGPELMTEALEALDPQPHGNVLDAGCGTGLSAATLKPFATKLTGIDLSPDMLELAVGRRLYDEIKETELTEYIHNHPETFDLVICSDTLCYFGDLSEVLAATCRSLKPGGVFVFSVEQLTTKSVNIDYEKEFSEAVKDEDSDSADEFEPAESETAGCEAETEIQDDSQLPDFKLQPNGRYSHKKSYVDQMIEQSGLKPIRIVHETLRHERGRRVEGMVVTVGRSN